MQVETPELPLHWQQYEIFEHPARFKVLAAGRRWGKTSLGRAALLESAVKKPGRVPENWHVYLGPTLVQARRVMWRSLLEAVPREWVEKDPNETRMEIELLTGGIIACMGADRPDALRGLGLQRFVGDEWSDMPAMEELWEPVILPQLLNTRGDALIVGTPKGFNHFYELWKRGQDGRADWMSWRYPTREAPHITPEYYAALVAEYDDPRIMRQELEASFESASGTILGDLWENTHTVQAHDTALLKRGLRVGQRVAWHVVDNPDWLPPTGSKLYGSVDYGFGAPCAIYLHATLPDGHIRTFWELYQRGLHDHEQATRLRLAIESLRTRKGDDGKPLNLPAPDWVVLEPMMYGSRREMGVAKTIAEVYADVLGGVTQLLQGAGGRAVRMSRPQRWRAALMPLPDGLPAWSCTTACPNLIRTVKTVRWDENDPEVPDDTGDDHAFEAVSRMLEARPIAPRVAKPDPYAHLDEISAAHHRALDYQLDPGGGDIPRLYVPL